MKKKILIAIAIVIAVVLLFPIPIRCKDGGTVKYQAVLYCVSDVHRFAPLENDVGYEDGIIIEILGIEVFNNVATVTEKTPSGDDSPLEEYNFSVATFEYAKDDGYKLITGEIDSLDTFDSLLLKPSDATFEGEWIYRIVFNPQEYSREAEEYIILFGEQSLSINGKTYIGDGIPYSEILEWASGKYAFFDYELIAK